MLTISTIKKTVLPLAKKYNLAKVELFGSYANGSATAKSDADFLVEFRVNPPSIFKVAGLREELSNSLNYPVDLVTLPLKNQNFDIGSVITVYEQA